MRHLKADRNEVGQTRMMTMFSKKEYTKVNGILRIVMTHIVVYCAIYLMHQKLQSSYFQQCTSNVIRFYMMKDSNMCRLMGTLSHLLERVIFVRLDLFIGNLHHLIQGI